MTSHRVYRFPEQEAIHCGLALNKLPISADIDKLPTSPLIAICPAAPAAQFKRPYRKRPGLRHSTKPQFPRRRGASDRALTFWGQRCAPTPGRGRVNLDIHKGTPSIEMLHSPYT